MTTISLIKWAIHTLSDSDRRRYIKKNLQLMTLWAEEREPDKMLTEFVNKYLGVDGVFILRLIGQNTDAVTVTQFVWELWTKWRTRRGEDTERDDVAEEIG